MGKGARGGALTILDAVLGEGQMLSDALARPDIAGMDPAEQARARRLAVDVLRGLERADRLLNRHLRKGPPVPVRNALRLGLIELVQGGAPHGVVHALVSEVARMKRHGALKGLVNAVLRKVAVEVPDAWDILRVPRLPKPMRLRLAEAWGPEAVTRMEAAHFAGAALDLTPGASGGPLPEGTRLPTGSIRLQGAPQVSALPGYAEGAWWVQDAAAAIPALVLGVQPEAAVLDMCAAPGGKTMQLAAAGARVTAVDQSAGRLARVEENLARTGLRANLVKSDARRVSGRFDAVLLDAPCSASGTIRRHPDLPHVKGMADLSELLTLQAELLDHGWRLLKPGGRLVFCTCSLWPEEGEGQLANFLKRCPEAVVDAAALDRPGIEAGWHAPGGGLRLRPDFWAEAGGMDGFFIAALRKPGENGD
jgi:16S rRNA (cytosine967-C5)-methyltransferase